GQYIFHVYRISEVESHCACRNHGGDQFGRIPAVMQYHHEVVVLYGIDDLFHIWRREFRALFRGQQPRRRLCDDYAVRAGFPESFCIRHKEFRCFFEQDMYSFGLIEKRHHYPGHVIEPARQRKGPDLASEGRSVAYVPRAECCSLYIRARSSRADPWYFKSSG